eukprot:m.39804 g.39804  ORF g.39804 m.39804 type:complete len:53 (-) comp9593_c0_seq3:760-918(-)
MKNGLTTNASFGLIFLAVTGLISQDGDDQAQDDAPRYFDNKISVMWIWMHKT